MIGLQTTTAFKIAFATITALMCVLILTTRPGECLSRCYPYEGVGREGMKPKVNITSEGIKRLLAVKHAKDVLVTECKNGQSWASGTHQLLK